MEKTFVIIDGNSLINRGYYAIQKPMITKEGIYTQGIYAFLSMLQKIRKDYEPTHMLVAFDRKAPTFRHLEFKDYKAGRKGMPAELAMEMPILKEILDAMGIARYEIDGFEADDILGTASLMSEQAGVRCFIVTGDRDALQLASDSTSVIINKKGMSDFKLYDDAAMQEEYGFDHQQFIDFKALKGDSSDNIPGVPGVGDKTAANLVKQFKSIENMLANIRQISNEKLRTKIEDYSMQLMMSKRLASIVRNVPMDLCFDDFEIKPQNNSLLIDIYTRLEFKTYLSKLLSEKPQAAVEEVKKLDIVYPVDISLDNENEAFDILNGISELHISFKSDNNHTDKPRAIAFAFIEGNKYYSLDIENLDDFLLSFFSKRKVTLYGFGLGIFFYYLISNGADVSGIDPGFDTAIANYLLNPASKEKSQDDIILEHLHISFSAQAAQLSLFDMAVKTGEDLKKLYLNSLLCGIMKKELLKAGLDKVFYDIELPLCKVLASMESSGFRIDRQALSEFGELLAGKISSVEQEIYELTGEIFNINSPLQLGKILFEKLGLPSGKKTSRGYSTNADVLEKLAPDYPVVDKVLEYRAYSKLKGTYVDGMLPLIAADGRIHPHFQQTVTSTGRISCTEPNLQNIPVKTELGRLLRKCFTAGEDSRILVGADYSQIELRILASMSGDKAMINSFNKGHDIHRETAARVFNVPADKVTAVQRSNAKAVNFGIIYGMSSYGLSQEIGVSVKTAEEYIREYFEEFGEVKAFLEKCKDDCRKNGEIRTLYGRRRMVPEINAPAFLVRSLGERLAMNTPIQGTAADIIKISMNAVYKRLADELPDARLILQIHDELIIDCNKKDEKRAASILVESMENAADLAVKLTVAENSAYNWYDLK